MQMLGAHAVDKGDIDFWALHPGGHRIVEVSRHTYRGGGVVFVERCRVICVWSSMVVASGMVYTGYA